MRAISILTVAVLALPVIAEAQISSSMRSETDGTFARIERDLGMVPEFIRQFPPEALPGAWDDMMALASEDVTIPAKYRELIGLAVAAQVPCHYCVFYHTEFARAQGAGEREIAEAVTLAAQTRRWSTVLNGNQIDFASFKKETDAVLAYTQADDKGKKVGMKASKAGGDPTLRDVEATLGRVPSFIAAYPEAARAGAWREMKALQLGTTAIPVMYKQLIELAVAAQVPCEYCTYFHDTMARSHGATDEQVRAAVAIAGNVRHWSTYLNGMAIDEDQFHQDVATILALSRGRDTGQAASGQ